MGFFLLAGWGGGGESLHPLQAKSFFISGLLPTKFLFPLRQKPKVNSTQQKNKNVLSSCSHCSSTIFVLISNSLETQIMLNLVLIDVQYSQNAVFSFKKLSNRQNHSSSGSHHLIKISRQQCSQS